MPTLKELQQDLERAIHDGQDIAQCVHEGSPSAAAAIRAAIARGDFEPEPEPSADAQPGPA